MKKIFNNLKLLKKNRSVFIHYQIDQLCPDCKNKLGIGPTNAIGEAYCPNCKEIKQIQ